jgi:prepilin peptidase CpaA
MTAEVVSVAGLALSGLYAARSDLRNRRLSNGLCLIVAAAGLSFELAFVGMAAAAGAAIHGAIALAIGAFLFAAGGWGGGDAKYYAAVACWFGLSRAITLLAMVSIVGLVLASGWLLALKLGVLSRADQAGDQRVKVPFGIAIAVGAVLAASNAA